MTSLNAEGSTMPALAVLLAAKALTPLQARQPAFAFHINLFKEQITSAKLAAKRLLGKKEEMTIKEEESLASTIYYAGKAPLAFAVLRNAHLLSGYSEWLLVRTLIESGHETAAQLLLENGFLSDKGSKNAVGKTLYSYLEIPERLCASPSVPSP